MNLYLDDVRDCPEGWVPVRNALDALQMLKEQVVEEMSFDHDLGGTLTGYDVLLWIERKVFEGKYNPPKMYVHTANPVGHKKMMAAIKSIDGLMRKRVVQKIVEQVHIVDVSVRDIRNLKTLFRGKRNVG